MKNHYDWLDKNLNQFWIKVFGKGLSETGCGGIIEAHGDKCYGYQKAWEDAGIPFPHGVAMYMLTYTRLIGETPKHQSKQWVIDNYPNYAKYLPTIKE